MDPLPKLIRIYSEKLGYQIDIQIEPNNLPNELYECLGMSNDDYG
jgi:hypothetical protein